MSVFQLIERLGAQASYTGAPNLDELEIDPELRKALENQDQAAIEKLLGADSNLMMVLVPAEDDDPSEDEPAEDQPEQNAQEIRQAG